jgi:hypothetical protein
MDWKRFFKPTIGKMLLFIALVAATSIPPNILLYGADIGLNYGFPFNFYGYGGGPSLMEGMAVHYYVNIPNALLDVAFWYLVSCGLAALSRRAIKTASGAQP